ncbi:hypothetical protein [Pseudomonas laurylsulfatiphila]
MVNRRNLLKLSALGTASFAAPLAYSASKITMAYNTGNPPGSTHPKDLIDNSEDLDLLMTAEADYEPNRLGAPLKSWKGMVREFDTAQSDRVLQFNTLMEATGYEPPIPYGPGILLDRTTKTVSYLGNEYRAKGSFIPMTTSNWASDEVKLKLIGDDSLRQNLADPDEGAAMVALPVPLPSAIIRSVADAFGDHLNMLSFRTPAVDAGRWDIALQAAIAKVEAIAVAAGRTHGLPAIEVPGGLYRMGAAVTTRPWIKIVARGSVTFDWTSVPASNGFIINNEITIAADQLKHPGNHSPCLNGNDGTISLLGAGRAISTGSALLIGNSVAGFEACRDTRISSIVVTGWDNAQKFNLRDTYLFHADNSRFENNNKNINVPAGTNTNSGERMQYYCCTFALADHQLYQDNVTFDFTFIGCSFDYFGRLVTYGANAGYCCARFITPHIEAFDSYLVDALSPIDQVDVFFTDYVVLPRRWTDASVVNSPSRRLFNTSDKVSISINGEKIRYEKRPYLEDSYTFSDATRISGYTGYHFNPQMGIPSAANIINRDYDFQIDADGTLGSVLTAWDRIAGFTSVSTNQITSVSGKKVLQLVGTDPAASAITFRSKDNIPARAGEQFLCNACVQANGVTGNINVLAGVEFFDVAGVSLGSFPAFRQYSFKDALADTTLPNYASGGVRYMDTTAFKAIAPKNTAYARARLTLTAFNGAVNVSRARCWKA